MTIDEIKKIIEKKVVGKIVSQHSDRGHFYLVGKKDPVLVSSVTQQIIVDRPHLIPWAIKKSFEWMEDKWNNVDKSNRDDYIRGAQKAPYDVRDDAGDVGSVAHNIIHEYAKAWMLAGVRPADIKAFANKDTDYRAIAATRSAEAQFIKQNCVPLASEILVGSKRHKAAGTLDMLVFSLASQEIELWDWKSSNSVSDEYALQVGAYKRLFEIMTKLKISTTKIMHLSKEYDKCVVYLVPEPDIGFKIWCNLSKVYMWRENGRKKLEKDVKVYTL